jgi:hypothetical protein
MPKTKKPVPDKFKDVTGTVESFISDGYSTINEVGEELREAYDNAPENLKGSSLNETRDSTASEIEGLSEPSLDSEVLNNLGCVTTLDNGKLYRGRMSMSRATRASNGASYLKAAAEAIREWLGENDEIPSADDVNDAETLKARVTKLEELEQKGIDPDDYEKAREEADTVADQLESDADTAEGLEYPGAFG